MKPFLPWNCKNMWGEGVGGRVCNRTYPTCKAHAQYYIAICGLFGSTTVLDIHEKGIELKTRVLIFATTSDTFLILRRIQRGIIVNV